MTPSPNLADRSPPVRSIRLAAVVFLAGLSAYGLLKAGFGVAPAFGFPAAALALGLTWRRLIRFAYAASRGVARFALALIRRVFDRRTYRFRLSTLLLATAIIAAVCAWYSYRLHAVRLETRQLAGKWQVIDSQGEPRMWHGKPIIEEFEQAIREGRCTIDPAQNPKWIDFHSASIED